MKVVGYRRYRQNEQRVCAHCHQPFIVPTYKVEAGDGRYCSKRCATMAQAWLAGYPDAAEVIALLYPVMSTAKLADFVGITYRQLMRHAATHGLKKDREWLIANRYDNWPEDPELRRVQCLALRLTAAVNKRSKELTNG